MKSYKYLINKYMKNYQSRFFNIMEADENAVTADQSADQAAANQQLTTTDVQDLGAVKGADQVAVAKQESTAAQLGELQSWIGKIDEFITYLNGVDDQSIQSKLHQAGCDSLFEKIARSETKKIARVAVDLSSLAESLKGYLIAGSNDNG